MSITYCTFCDASSHEMDTLILNVHSDPQWISFCEPCGRTETLTNAEGKSFTVKAVFDGEHND